MSAKFGVGSAELFSLQDLTGGIVIVGAQRQVAADYQSNVPGSPRQVVVAVAGFALDSKTTLAICDPFVFWFLCVEPKLGSAAFLQSKQFNGSLRGNLVAKTNSSRSPKGVRP